MELPAVDGVNIGSSGELPPLHSAGAGGPQLSIRAL